MSCDGPVTNENTPAGNPRSMVARAVARATSSPTPGCAGCPRTATGQPAASAAAVSPPATEKASGKLLAPKIATGPTGILRRRRSGRRGVRSGCAVSTRSPSQLALPHDRAANNRSWPIVRVRSPSSRPRGRPHSDIARTISSSPMSATLSAIVSRKRARSSTLVSRNASNALAASSHARSIRRCWQRRTGGRARPLSPHRARDTSRGRRLPLSL